MTEDPRRARQLIDLLSNPAFDWGIMEALKTQFQKEDAVARGKARKGTLDEIHYAQGVADGVDRCIARLQNLKKEMEDLRKETEEDASKRAA